MKALTTLLLVLMMAITAGCAVAEPDLVIYRFNGVDTKILPADLILGANSKIDPWIRDDTRWPQGKRIALLVHGFPFFAPGQCRNGLIALATDLSRPRKCGEITIPAYDVIYVIEYPPKFSIMDTSSVLANLIRDRCANFLKGQRIDAFAHSMGGLVVRWPLEIKSKRYELLTDLVAHLVTFATPNGGFAEAYLINDVETLPEVKDVEPESLFMLALDNAQKKNDCRYYSIVGTCSYKPQQYQVPFMLSAAFKVFKDGAHTIHDGLIDASSAGYDLSPFCISFKKAEFPLNHDFIKADQQVFSQIDRWMIEDKWFGDLAVSPVIQLKITKFTGGLPILLGKSQADIIKLFGQPNIEDHDIVGLASHGKRLYWGYEYKFSNTSITDCVGLRLTFSEYANEDKKSLGDSSKVHVVNYLGVYNHNWTPSKFVPKEILALPPSFICRSHNDNYFDCLIVIWIIDNKTYCLELGDSKRKLYDRVNGKYYLNDNGRNFQVCDRVNLFLQIDKIPDIFNPKLQEHYFCDGIIEYPGNLLLFHRFDEK